MSYSRIVALKEEGDIHKALEMIEQIQEHYTPDHPDFINLQLMKSEIWIITSRYSEAKRLLNNLIDIARRKKNLLAKLDTIILLAELYWQVGQLDQAILMIEMGEIDFTKLSGDYSDQEKSLRYAQLKRLKGIYYKFNGEIDLALEYFNESLVEAEQLENDKFIADIYNLNGLIHQEIGDLTKAWNYYIQAYKIRQQSSDRLGEGFTLYNLGRIQEYIGELDHAFKYYREALDIAKSIDNRRLRAHCLTSIGTVYHQKGKFQEAMHHFSRSLAIREDLENDIETSWTLYRILNLLLNSEKSELAPIYMDGLEKLLEKNNQNTVIRQHNQLIKANMLKNEDKTVDKAEAQQILYKVLDNSVVAHELSISAMLSLCDILLQEFKHTGNEEILSELDFLFNGLQDFVEQQHSYPLLAEILLLQGKYAILEQDFNKALLLFERGQKIASNKKLFLLEQRLTEAIEATNTKVNELGDYSDNEANILHYMENSDRDREVAQLIKNHTKSRLLSQEHPVLFMILHGEHKRIYDRIILQDLVNDQLIESFLTVINKIIKQSFRTPSPVERIIHGDFFILVKTIDQLQFIYVFKGRHSLTSFQRFDEIVLDLLTKKEILDQLKEGNGEGIKSDIDQIINSHLELIE